MSTADAFSPDITAAYARKMVERESRGNGDQMNALDRVGRRCGMTARSLRRLINGETKDPGLSVFSRVRAAYLDYCARQIAELQHEIEVEKARIGVDDTFADLAAEAEVLAAKVERAKRGVKG
ncbi:hypothetical protein IB238_09200 [Rhizobium sp. ARZ01]|uniref:hypothetical protein n=1 Tax=Rhizobium sp. ARZ01 TaxID=2769313 RepID=UPI0017814B7A|nr:hypothetical protein [Rhizobium sp. ARZ01]MBD9372795.1 hypothetical protein [Rhizobium sp. ARZ01]